jgi:hypothetical protein
MSGVPSQVVNRLRLLLLAVVCWLCLVPTAHALRAPIPAEPQLKEESPLPEPSIGYVVYVVDGEMRIGLFVKNSPINYLDPDGEFALVGGLVSVGLGAGIAWLTGDCYSAKDALIDFGTGAIGTGLAAKLSKVVKPGWSKANKAFPRGIERAEDSHFIPRRFSNPKSPDYKGLPKWLTENPLNKTRIPGEVHAKADPARHRFLKQPWKDDSTPYDPFRKSWYRTPPWMKGGAAGGVGTPAGDEGSGDCNFWSWD